MVHGFTEHKIHENGALYCIFNKFIVPTAMSQKESRHTYDSLKIGDIHEIHRFVSEDDVLTFARITGDDNPIHVDEEYAQSTRFGHRVVHGVLQLGLISKVLGRDFPGSGSIAVSISCRFLRPVRVNSEVLVSVKIIEKLEKRGYVKAETNIYTENNKLALAGEATIIPPREDAP